MSPNSYNSDAYNVWAIQDRGNLNAYASYYPYAIYPATYLKENIKILGGNGTISSPYELSL